MADINILDDDEPLYLDEEDELYGYGVINVHNNQFVPILGGGPLGGDSSIVTDEEEALEHYVEQCEDGNESHLRLVRVHLDNELDKEAMQRVLSSEN